MALSRKPTETEERDFEIEYSGMSASMCGSVSVDVHAPSPRLSSWDLRRETSQQREIVPLGDIEKDAQKFISENKNCDDFINNLLKSAAKITGVPSVQNPFSGNLIDFSPQKVTTKDGKTEIIEAQAFGRFYTLPNNNGTRESFGYMGITPLTTEWVNPKYEYIIKYIHESIHNAAMSGGLDGSRASDTTAYTDRIMAIAAFDVISNKPENERLKIAKENYQRILTNKSYQNTTEYSRFWNSLLRYHYPKN